MTHPFSTRTASLITIAAVSCMITAVLHPTANAQSPDPQQKCATEAKIAFQDLRREYDAEARGLQLKVDVRLNDYRHYYNTKLERCLLVLNKNTSGRTLPHVLPDRHRSTHVCYLHGNEQVQSCTLIQSVRQTMACKSRDEFDAFVSQYMGKQK